MQEDPPPDSSETSNAPWEDILTSGTVLKQMIRSVGPDGVRPEYKQSALVHVVGREATTQRIFLNTYETNKPLEIQVGDQIMELVTPGLMLGIRMLAVGEKCRLKVISRYAYGPTGSLEYQIPPDADLEYQVETVEVLDFPKEAADMSPEELLKVVVKLKLRGNQFFEWGEKDKALRCYNEALKFGDAANSSKAILPELEKERAACCNNVALVFEKQGKLKECKEACVNALVLDPNNVKAMIRAARVSTLRGEHDEAAAALKLALEIEPGNASAQQAVKALKVAAEKARKLESEAYGGFLRPVKSAPAAASGDDLSAPPPPPPTSPKPPPPPSLSPAEGVTSPIVVPVGKGDDEVDGSGRVLVEQIPSSRRGDRVRVKQAAGNLAVLLMPTWLAILWLVLRRWLL